MFSKIKTFFHTKKSNFKVFIDKKIDNLKLFLYKKFEKPITFTKSNFKKILNYIKKICIKFHLPDFCKKLKLDKLYIFLRKIINKQLLKKIFLLIIIPFIIYLYFQFLCYGKFIFEKPRL